MTSPIRIVVASGLAVLALAPNVVEAHASGATTFGALPWTFESWEIGFLVLSAGLYVTGVWRLWRRAGVGRGVGYAELTAFTLGLLALVVAVVSPVDALADSLFSAHMIEHELMMIVAAPLLVIARPLAAWAWALPAAWRVAIGRFFHRTGWRRPWLLFTGPLWAWILHLLALWLWHVPALFEAAVANEAVHAFQHICFLGTALIFWWSVLGKTTRHHRGVALVSIFTTMIHTGALGALLVLSNVVWYTSYLKTTQAWGLTPLQDQQLGGIIMWVPTGFVYIGCGLWLMHRWLSETPRFSRGLTTAVETNVR